MGDNEGEDPTKRKLRSGKEQDLKTPPPRTKKKGVAFSDKDKLNEHIKQVLNFAKGGKGKKSKRNRSIDDEVVEVDPTNASTPVHGGARSVVVSEGAGATSDENFQSCREDAHDIWEGYDSDDSSDERDRFVPLSSPHFNEVVGLMDRTKDSLDQEIQHLFQLNIKYLDKNDF